MVQKCVLDCFVLLIMMIHCFAMRKAGYKFLKLKNLHEAWGEGVYLDLCLLNAGAGSSQGRWLGLGSCKNKRFEHPLDASHSSVQNTWIWLQVGLKQLL